MKTTKIARLAAGLAWIMEQGIEAAKIGVLTILIFASEVMVEPVLAWRRGGDDYEARERASALRNLFARNQVHRENRELEKRIGEQWPDLAGRRIE